MMYVLRCVEYLPNIEVGMRLSVTQMEMICHEDDSAPLDKHSKEFYSFRREEENINGNMKGQSYTEKTSLKEPCYSSEDCNEHTERKQEEKNNPLSVSPFCLIPYWDSPLAKYHLETRGKRNQ